MYTKAEIDNMTDADYTKLLDDAKLQASDAYHSLLTAGAYLAAHEPPHKLGEPDTITRLQNAVFTVANDIDLLPALPHHADPKLVTRADVARHGR